MSARDEILGRIRHALADVPAGERAEGVRVARGYRRTPSQEPADLVGLLEERLVDYYAEVRRVHPGAIREAVEEGCAKFRLGSVVVPANAPDAWRPSDIEVVVDDRLGVAELDRIDGAITGCAVAIAETGTLILDGHGVCGRRALTLIPDHHICVVRDEQVVGSVPEAIAAMAPAVRERRVPVTMISGPSATSDIELSRVEGVHGPRHLLVLIVGGDGRRT